MSRFVSRVLFRSCDWLGYYVIEAAQDFGSWLYEQGFKHGVRCGALVRNAPGKEPLWIEADE